MVNKFKDFVLYFEELNKKGIVWGKGDLIGKAEELGITKKEHNKIINKDKNKTTIEIRTDILNLFNKLDRYEKEKIAEELTDISRQSY